MVLEVLSHDDGRQVRRLGERAEAAAHVPSIKFLVGSLFGGKTAMPKSSTKGYFKRKSLKATKGRDELARPSSHW